MRFHVITLFPEMIEVMSRFGVVGQAVQDGRVSISSLSPRVFTSNVHQTVDDRPFGGGDGMIMMAEPLAMAIENIVKSIKEASAATPPRLRVIHLSPRGVPLTDEKVRELAGLDQLVLLASRYGGVDQRLLNHLVDEEISVGDYVLSGGELPALTLIDAVSRQLPGVLGNETSAEEESFAEGLLEYPQFTRPREWRGDGVPTRLLSGDHAKIAQWKRGVSVLVSVERRPDLLERALAQSGEEALWTGRDLRAALDVLDSMSVEERRICGIREPVRVRARLLELLARFPVPVKSGARRRRSAALGSSGEEK